MFTKKRSEWSIVEAVINDNNTLYTKILTAAYERGDTTMITRLHGVVNGDLVAVEARYHRKKNCVSTYINPRNVSSQTKVGCHDI